MSLPVSTNQPLLQVSDLKKHFPITGGFFGGVTAKVYAVDGVSFAIGKGETLSLVGESGCGKSTVGKAILKLFPITSGEVVLDGQRIDAMSSGTLRPIRRRIQVVFQDPFSSLNPRLKVRDILAEPITNFGLAKDRADIDRRIGDLMDTVRLPRDAVNRWPHEFSGGQRQRIGIARALILEPKIVILDEPVSALDVSIRAQIINLLLELKATLGLSYIMISHDLGVVEHMSDRVAVMYLGRIVESGPWEEIFARPGHPYTRALIAAIPDPFKLSRGTRISGEIPNPLDPPTGCSFHPRCPEARDGCRVPPIPDLDQVATGHFVRCRRFHEIGRMQPAAAEA